MRRALLVFLSLLLALTGSAVSAQDGFYVIPSLKTVPKTGQTTSYGTRDDGALEKGVAWPTPRFTDNNDGTVTDNLTRLIWMKNANAFSTRTWAEALDLANNLASGSYGLSDGSQAGDWRLPNIKELQSLIDFSKSYPPLPENHPFTNWLGAYYWSSTTRAHGSPEAWIVYFTEGNLGWYAKSLGNCYVWCVRGGQ